MAKLSENFDDSEFRCKCCGKLPENGINPKLIELLQSIRDKLGRSITITYHGGYRCEHQNKLSGGAKRSQHLLGNAADIKVTGMTAHEVHDYIASHFGQRCKGLGKYNTFTHVDVRDGALARWDETKRK